MSTRSPRRLRGPSQSERVRAMLERGWTCGVMFLDASPPILRYTGRIHEIRQEGYLVERRACAHPWHDHQTRMWEWRIVSLPGEAAPLPGLGGSR